MITNYFNQSDERLQDVLDILKDDYQLPIDNIFKISGSADVHIAKYVADDEDDDYTCFHINIRVLTGELTATIAVLFWRLLWLMTLPIKLWKHGWSEAIGLYNMVRFVGRDENDDVFLQLIHMEEDDPNTPLFQYIDENFDFGS